MSTTINAGAAASISLPAEQSIFGRGPGSAVIASTQATYVQPLTAGDEWRIGPFDQARTVGITAIGAAISYDVTTLVDPARQVVAGDDGVPRDSKFGSSVQGGGIPSAFTTRALTDADNGAVLVAAGAAVATVNTGRASGFGCTFVGAGAVTFAGTATVTDYRTTGATNPSCALIQIGTDAYGVYGSKA